MIKRVVFLAAALVAAWNLALGLPAIRRQFSVTQGRNEENLVKAQEYALSDRPYRVVVVGSSLAQAIPEEGLGPGAFNLSLGGGSAFTGLELIARHAARPTFVLIETNRIPLQEADRELLENAGRPIVAKLRQHLPSLREKFKPANFFAGRVLRLALVRAQRLVATRPTDPARSEIAKPAAAKPSAAPEDPATIALGRERAWQAFPPDPRKLVSRVARLRALVDTLEQRGVHCLFLEMPVDASLTDTTFSVAVRSALKAEFPESEVPWMPPPPDRAFHPRDGLHLNAAEAAEFAAYLRGRLALAEAAGPGLPVRSSDAASN